MTDHAHSVPSQATNVRTTSGARARRATLVTVLEELGYCSIQELAERFGVSEMTIRRDVALLVGTGQVRAFHGAAGSLPPSMLTGVDYTERHSTMNTAKRAIAKHAATLMSRGSVVGIDAGTTGAQLAAVLPTDADLTVVTHSLAAISTLSRFPGVAVIGLGAPSTETHCRSTARARSAPFTISPSISYSSPRAA